MANEMTIQQKIEKELRQAYQAQKNGKEGLARVCARRAAGWAIQELLRKEGNPYNNPSALEQIKHYAEREGLSEKMRTVLHHLVIKLEKDSLESESYYPIEGVDLVKEAHWLVEEILDFRFVIED